MIKKTVVQAFFPITVALIDLLRQKKVSSYPFHLGRLKQLIIDPLDAFHK